MPVESSWIDAQAIVWRQVDKQCQRRGKKASIRTYGMNDRRDMAPDDYQFYNILNKYRNPTHTIYYNNILHAHL